MPGSSLFLFIFLLAVLGWCIRWHIRENKALSTHWKTKEALDLHDKDELTRIAWSRSFQLFAALIVLFITIIFYNTQVTNLREELARLKKPSPPQNYPTLVPQQPERKPFPTIAEPKPEAKQPKKTSAPPQNNPPPMIVDIFKPHETQSDQASIIDSLKQQYEDTLVLYFIMKRCKYAKDDDYYLIVGALKRSLEFAGATENTHQHIVNAAQGSYKELYAKNPCRTKDMKIIAKDYRNYIDSLVSAQ